MNIQELAEIVKSNFKKLTESDIIGRIMLLSGRNLERSLKGYGMLRSEGLLNDFVEPTTDGKFLLMLEKYPNLHELIDRMDFVPQKMEVKAGVKPSGYKAPERTDPKKVIDALNLRPF